MNAPLVTVLMSVYNAEKYLSEAIHSILNQTYSDFEFLIINDASTDTSLKIMESINDPRIKIVSNSKNLGLTQSLNNGFKLAKGKYVARMDADDISQTERLEKQVAFMEKHPSVGLCGTFIKTLGLEKDYDIAFCTSHDEIKFRLFFDTHFPHPAAMIRKSVLDEHDLKFDITNLRAQDYELWNKMAACCELAIIPEILVLKRSHTDQISIKHVDAQNQVIKKTHKLLMQNLGLSPSAGEMDVYESFLGGKILSNKNDVFALLDLFDTLIEANNKIKIYNSDLFNQYFSEKYWMICTRSTHFGLSIFRKYKRSFVKKNQQLKPIHYYKFLLKTLLKYRYETR